MEKKPVYIAVDCAYAQGGVLLFDEQAIYYQKNLATRFAHGQELAAGLKEAQDVAAEKDLVIAGFFCGLGPGSFVGIRLALATALGYSFAKSIPLMGFCSHDALAYSVVDNLVRFRVVMKASGPLYYVSEYVREKDSLTQLAPTKVMSLDDVVSEDVIIITDQPEQVLAQQTHAPLQTIFGPCVAGIYAAAKAKLNEGLVDQSANIKPNYLKPPSISPPKISSLVSLSL